MQTFMHNGSTRFLNIFFYESVIELPYKYFKDMNEMRTISVALLIDEEVDAGDQDNLYKSSAMQQTGNSLDLSQLFV